MWHDEVVKVGSVSKIRTKEGKFLKKESLRCAH